MLLSMNVYATIEGKKIRCEVLRSFYNRKTQKSYVIIFAPIKNESESLIPLLFDPDIDVQEAELLSDEQDILVIEDIIDKNNVDIMYLPPDNIAFEIHITHHTDSEIKKYREIFANNLRDLPVEKIDDLVKYIDGKIIHIKSEEYLSELKEKDNSQSGIVLGLITNILKVERDVPLTHIPLNAINQIMSSYSIVVSVQEKKLFKAFEDIIVALGKSEIISQDVENALCNLVECENCTDELFDLIINHKTFSELFARDILQSIKYSIVRKKPDFFSLINIETAADYYYSKGEFESSLRLYKKQYQALNDYLENSSNVELANILNSMGCCYLGLINFEEAYRVFKEAINTDNKCAVAYNNLAYTLSVKAESVKEDKRHNILQEALMHINDAIQRDTSNISFLSNRAYIEYELGQYEHVIKDFYYAQERTKEYSDISTILKLKIDAQIRLYIYSPKEYPLKFSDLYQDLQIIYNNELGVNRLYYKVFDVFDKIRDNEDSEKADFILSQLLLFEFYIKELMASITIRNPYQEIYYYTNMESLCKLLCDDKSSIKYRLPIFGANHMNDPSEGLELEKAFIKHSKDDKLFKDLFSHLNGFSNSKRQHLEAEFTFLKAFTKNEDSLPMWVHYADSGKGCCVKVNHNFFTNFDDVTLADEKTLVTNPFDNKYRLYEVLYIDEGKIINAASSDIEAMCYSMFDKFSEISKTYGSFKVSTQKAILSSMGKMFDKLKYLFKSADYVYEQEMRVVLRRPLNDLKRDDIDIQTTDDTSTNSIPKVFLYTNRSLLVEEIILGPKVGEINDLIPFFTMKLLDINDYNWEKVCITKSAIEYR